MGQLVYPQTLSGDGGVHSILFNINTRSSADSAADNSRIVENADGKSSSMNQLYKNPYGNAPILYSKDGEHANTPSTVKQYGIISSYTRTENSVVLQMPDNIGSSYGIEWKHSDFGLATRLSNLLWTASEDTSEAASQLKESVMASTGEFMATGIQKISGVNLMDMLNHTRGKIINPLVETIFKGVVNRQFTFKFRFFPRNAGESQSILDIITTFKRHMHPELLNGVKPYFKYPDTFDITFMLDSGEPNPWLFRMSTSALTNLETNDTPESKYITHEGGAPLVRELILTFAEMEQLHKEKFKLGSSY
jgi:hypothetical protein